MNLSPATAAERPAGVVTSTSTAPFPAGYQATMEVAVTSVKKPRWVPKKTALA